MLTVQEIAHLNAHIAHYPEKRAGAIYCLYFVQDKYGYITKEGLDSVSKLTHLSVTQLDEIITFYTLLRRRPVGRNVIRVCDSISCHTRGAQHVLAAARNITTKELGEMTNDGSVTVLPSICLGLCDRAPAALINDDRVEGELTPEKMRILLSQLAAEEMELAKKPHHRSMIAILTPQTETIDSLLGEEA